MKYNGAMAVTTYQVGANVYVPYTESSTASKRVTIAKSESVVNNAGVQTNVYYFVDHGGFNLPQSLVFANKTTLQAYVDAQVGALP